MDPDQAALEDLVRTKRIEEIYSLKKSIQVLQEDIARNLATKRLGGDPSKAYLLLVKSYIRALETLLMDTRYWENVEVGRYELPDGSLKRVIGLDGYLQLHLTETVEWTVEAKPSRNKMEEELTRSATVTPPRRLSSNAYRYANVALDERGIEIDAEDATVDGDYAADGPGIGR